METRRRPDVLFQNIIMEHDAAFSDKKTSIKERRSVFCMITPLNPKINPLINFFGEIARIYLIIIIHFVIMVP